MHPTAISHNLTVVGLILVLALSTNADSSDLANPPTRAGAMRFDYKRRSVSGLVHPAAVPPPAQVAPRILALPNRLPQSCHGPIPMPAALGDPIPHPDAFGSLRDWCVRGPARCTCAWQVSSQTYNLQCDIGDHLLDTVPEIVDCHNNCDCGEPDPAARIQALAAAALFLARVRAGVGP